MSEKKSKYDYGRKCERGYLKNLQIISERIKAGKSETNDPKQTLQKENRKKKQDFRLELKKNTKSKYKKTKKKTKYISI